MKSNKKSDKFGAFEDKKRMNEMQLLIPLEFEKVLRQACKECVTQDYAFNFGLVLKPFIVLQNSFLNLPRKEIKSTEIIVKPKKSNFLYLTHE